VDGRARWPAHPPSSVDRVDFAGAKEEAAVRGVVAGPLRQVWAATSGAGFGWRALRDGRPRLPRASRSLRRVPTAPAAAPGRTTALRESSCSSAHQRFRFWRMGIALAGSIPWDHLTPRPFPGVEMPYEASGTGAHFPGPATRRRPSVGLGRQQHRARRGSQGDTPLTPAGAETRYRDHEEPSTNEVQAR
jgi:hypothetical protein